MNEQVELGQKATDSTYREFQRTVNANIKDGARIRLQILLRKLLATDPGFAEMLDPVAVSETGLKASVALDAKDLVTLIGGINEQYSAQHGEDLFKATNKTAQAQANIAKAVEDFDDYRDLLTTYTFYSMKAWELASLGRFQSPLET